MNEYICATDGCDRPFHARGFCQMHYKQWRAANPTDVRHYPPPERGSLRVCRQCDMAVGWYEKHGERAAAYLNRRSLRAAS